MKTPVMINLILLWTCLGCVADAAVSAPKSTQAAAPTQAAMSTQAAAPIAASNPSRLLFVGNSYLYYGDSVHNHVYRLAAELGPHAKTNLQYKSATIGGARLAHHSLKHLLEPGRLGVDQPFEIVILQGGSNETLTVENRARFRLAAQKLGAQIKAKGSQIALYMTPAYVSPHENVKPNMIDQIAQTYVSVANDIGALVLPVGLAFDRAYRQRPDIVLHKPFDGSHPTLLGTYLAACVVYASLYEKSVTAASYDYFGAISSADARFLRGVAQATVRAFHSGTPIRSSAKLGSVVNMENQHERTP